MNAKLLDDLASALTIAGIALFCAGVRVYQLSKLERDKESAKTDGV